LPARAYQQIVTGDNRKTKQKAGAAPHPLQE
jgi:hypothetical protein